MRVSQERQEGNLESSAAWPLWTVSPPTPPYNEAWHLFEVFTSRAGIWLVVSSALVFRGTPCVLDAVEIFHSLSSSWFHVHVFTVPQCSVLTGRARACLKTVCVCTYFLHEFRNVCIEWTIKEGSKLWSRAYSAVPVSAPGP